MCVDRAFEAPRDSLPLARLAWYPVSLMAEPLVRIVAAGDTHIGCREHNEDSILIRRELDLFAVADGAGGENAGNVASSLAVSTLAHDFEQTPERASGFDVLGLPWAARRLSQAVHHANTEVVALARSSDKYRGMGTTLVAISVNRIDAIVHLAHVGDSRCYRLRAGHLELLTQDHSLANDVLELAPDLSEERARALPSRVITRALGMGPKVRVTMQSLAITPGDRYLLCSDGLTDMLDEEQIADALRQDLRPDAAVKLLLDIANAANARDNLAAVVLECRSAGTVDWPSPTLRRRLTAPGSNGKTEEARDEGSEPEIVIIEGDDPTDDADVEDDDAPEIEISGGSDPAPAGDGVPLAVAEPEEAPTTELSITFLPEGSASSAKRQAVRMVLGEFPADARPGSEKDPTLRYQRTCAKCGSIFDGKASACPNCWGE